MAKSFDVPFLEVSAKNSTNIEETFTKMASDIHERFLQMKKTKNKLVPGAGTPLWAPVVINSLKEDESKKKTGTCCQ